MTADVTQRPALPTPAPAAVPAYLRAARQYGAAAIPAGGRESCCEESEECEERGVSVEYASDVRDPRAADYPEDTRLWRIVLMHTWLEDGDDPDGVYGALLGIRACGAALVRRGSTLRIEPRYAPKTPIEDEAGTAHLLGTETAWATEVEWAADRDRYLLPHRAAIARLLALVAEGEG